MSGHGDDAGSFRRPSEAYEAILKALFVSSSSILILVIPIDWIRCIGHC